MGICEGDKLPVHPLIEVAPVEAYSVAREHGEARDFGCPELKIFRDIELAPSTDGARKGKQEGGGELSHIQLVIKD